MGRRRSGTVRKVASGRWQARHLDPAGTRVTAPGTFATKTDALRWLAAASGTSPKAIMARIGHNSMTAALRYQHVIDGQDADIVKYLERFGEPADDAPEDDGPTGEGAQR